MAVKGFYDNPQEATIPADSDLLAIQTGTTLADMKKITYENLVKPLDTAKANKDTDAVAGHIAVFDADGNPVDGVNVPSDFEIISRKKTTWSTPTSDLNYSSEKLVKASLDAQETRIAENESDIATNISDIGDLELAVAGIDEDIIALDGRLDTLEGADTVVGSVAKTVKDAVEPIIEDVSDHEVRIQTLEGIVNVTSWAGVQKVVREGLAEKYFSVGDQLVAEYDGVEKIWDIIGFDIDTPTDENFTHSMTIQSREVLRYGSRIDAPQAMYNAVTSLPAGTHIFTTNGVQYQVTTTVEIPAGGVLYIATRNEYIPLTLTSYQPDRKTAIETGLAVTTTTGVDTLTPINDHVRMRYGSNRYIDSALRQWLNSDDVIFTWTPKGLYDMPSVYETEGFVNILDADLKAVIGSVDKQVARATYDGGGQDTFEDKVFLLSRVEMGLGTEGVTTGEVVYPFWDGATDADRIKYQGVTARYWWLRSPLVSLTHTVRTIYPGGNLYYHSAYNGIGVSPACVII